jgi:hypothetical protein
MSHRPDDERESVVVHFVRSPSGALRCRVVDAESKVAWLVPSAAALHRLIFSSGLHEPVCGISANHEDEIRNDET